MKTITALILLAASISPAMADETAESIDIKLNAIYQQTLKKLTGEQRQKLIQNQRDWLKYAQGYCHLTDGHPMKEQLAGCFAGLSLERIKDIELVWCDEGDLSPSCMIPYPYRP